MRPLPSPLRRADLDAATSGAKAGAIASVVQVALGWLLDQLLLPPGHDNNIAPRLVDRAAARAGQDTHPLLDWILGSVFHFGYGLGWGALFGLLRRHLPLPSLALGSAMGGAIYLIAFSRAGVGTRTGSEAHPDRRPWQKQVSLLSVAMGYALSVAVVFDRLPGRPLPSIRGRREPLAHLDDPGTARR